MISDELKGVILTALSLADYDFSDATKASDVPGWDSLNHVNVILAVEKHFNVRFKSAGNEHGRFVGTFPGFGLQRRGSHGGTSGNRENDAIVPGSCPGVKEPDKKVASQLGARPFHRGQ